LTAVVALDATWTRVHAVLASSPPLSRMLGPCAGEADPSRCQGCGAELAGPYAVSVAALGQTTPGGAIEVPYAGFWRRLGAFALDGLVLSIVGQGLGVAFAERFATLGQSGRWIGSVAAIYIIPAHHRGGQTLGGRALGLRVQTLDGGPLSLSVASLRYLALAVPWFLNGLFHRSPVALGASDRGGCDLRLAVVCRDRRKPLFAHLQPTVPPTPPRLGGRHGRGEGEHRAGGATPLQMAQLQSAQAALSHSPGVLQGSLGPAEFRHEGAHARHRRTVVDRRPR
jgi:uncharacterized RDD family membrane protein YckC